MTASLRPGALRLALARREAARALSRKAATRQATPQYRASIRRGQNSTPHASQWTALILAPSCGLSTVEEKPESLLHVLVAGPPEREEQHQRRDHYLGEGSVRLDDVGTKGRLDRLRKLDVQGMTGRPPAGGPARTARGCLCGHGR